MPLDGHDPREAFLSGKVEDYRPIPHLDERPWIAVVAASGELPDVALQVLRAELVERAFVSPLPLGPEPLHPDR